MSKRRVVITGMGIVSPVGADLETAWKNVCNGVSGVRSVTSYDMSAYTTQFAGVVSDDFDASNWMGPKEVRKTDPFIHYGFAAAKQAVADSGLEITDANRHRIAVGIGSGIGGIGSIEKEVTTLNKSGPRRVSPFFVPSSIINMVSGYVSIDLGTTGPSFGVVSACTTGTHSIGLGARLIQYGDCDVFLAGGAEAGSSPAGMAGFCQIRALSTRNDAPEKASRPWDKDRDGFVLGDGAGVLVLEEYESAKARGAKIYAEVVGFGMSSDAYHITQPLEGAPQVARCMSNALTDAGLNASDVDTINAHATSTPQGDIAESDAIKNSLGAHASKVSITSTKSMTGHLLGAAGGIEAIFSALSLRDQVVPPTINLDNPSEGCDLDYTAHTAKERVLNVALSNSFGFGGTNGTLVLRRI